LCQLTSKNKLKLLNFPFAINRMEVTSQQAESLNVGIKYANKCVLNKKQRE
jgi:hypothetical protein